MTRAEFGIGLYTASPVFFVAAGACVHFVSGGLALLVGAAAWVGAAIALVRALKQ